MENSVEATTSISRASFTLIGILGRPGAGKGTQCQRLSRMFAVEHISIGDVLRAEMERKGSPHAAMIRQNMLAGTVGPKEVTIPILKSHIVTLSDAGAKVFLLDGEWHSVPVHRRKDRSEYQQTNYLVLPGFPRNLDQLQYFESLVGPINFIILLECGERVALDRLLSRGRFDDNVDNIRCRLLTFDHTTSKVVEAFTSRERCKTVNAEMSVEGVDDQLAEIFNNLQITKR